MQIDWEVVTCLVIGFFAIVGFSRGWWKEGLTTLFLLILFILLRQPSWAQSFIDLINRIIDAIWSLIPDSVIEIFNQDIVGTTAAGTPPIQADANSAGTWVVILILFIATSIFLGRIWLSSPPTIQGSLLGLLIGALNGFFILNLVREYLDGRSLPGGETAAAASSQIVLAGNGAFAPPASSVSIQATDLPNFTILDSNIPWFIIVGGLLISFAVLRSRFKVLTNPKGMKKLSFKELPPFYKPPPPPKKTELDNFIKKVKEIFEGTS